MAATPRQRLAALIQDLEAATQRDPEQEVTGMAVPVLDAVLTEAKAALGGDPVVAVMRDVISPETIEAGEPIRALDALIVARQLHAALPKPPPLVSF